MTSAEPRWFHPAGSLARGSWELVVDNQLPGWSHTGLRIADLDRTDSVELSAEMRERIVIPLAGTAVIEWRDGDASGTVELAGRPDVFGGPADSASFGPGTSLRLSGTGRVAVADAMARNSRPPAVLRADETQVEIRGAGVATREVRNFGVPGALPAERLIVCEVITPSGNWSSYPPHKHDEETGSESSLEEIYYFEIAQERGAAAPRSEPFATFAAYSSDSRPIAISELVHTGDVALVPYGFHGPAGAAPGYDLYYLNVMAGPGAERAWRITDDSRHAWVRSDWETTPTDPRLPTAR